MNNQKTKNDATERVSTANSCYIALARKWRKEAKKLMMRTDQFNEYANVAESQTLERCAKELKAI